MKKKNKQSKKAQKPKKVQVVKQPQEPRECSKCKKFFILEKHHILPQSTFGENDTTDDLCPNCHAEYHRFLGKEIKNPDMVFHLALYYKWVAGLLGILLLLFLYHAL